MVSTISPVVYRNTIYKDCKWVTSAGIYTIGSVIGATATGTFFGLVGVLMSTVDLTISASVIFLVSLLYSLHELKIISLPYIERKKQVPLSWRSKFHPYISSGLYGFLLGMGIVTFIPTTSFHVLILTTVFSGSMGYSISLFAIFGITRTLPFWLVSKTVTGTKTIEALGEIVGLTKPIVHQFNGALLATYAMFLLFNYFVK